MRLLNWSSRMFHVTFGNCLVNSVGEGLLIREAGLEVGEQLDGLGAAVRADRWRRPDAAGLGHDRRWAVDRRMAWRRGRPPASPSDFVDGDMSTPPGICFVAVRERTWSLQRLEPSFGGAVVPLTTTSGVSSTEGGDLRAPLDLAQEELGAAPSRFEQLLTDRS